MSQHTTNASSIPAVHRMDANIRQASGSSEQFCAHAPRAQMTLHEDRSGEQHPQSASLEHVKEHA
jgi:hypothetical protein